MTLIRSITIQLQGSMIAIINEFIIYFLIFSVLFFLNFYNYNDQLMN